MDNNYQETTPLHTKMYLAKVPFNVTIVKHDLLNQKGFWKIVDNESPVIL